MLIALLVVDASVAFALPHHHGQHHDLAGKGGNVEEGQDHGDSHEHAHDADSILHGHSHDGEHDEGHGHDGDHGSHDGDHDEDADFGLAAADHDHDHDRQPSDHSGHWHVHGLQVVASEPLICKVPVPQTPSPAPTLFPDQLRFIELPSVTFKPPRLA